MPLLETTVAAVGRLALAAAYAGPDGGSGAASPLEAAIYTTAALAWPSERKTLTRHNLDHDAKAAVRFKDVLVAGSVARGFATLAVQELMKWKNGGSTNGHAGSPRSLHAMSTLNKIFVAGAVAATPFINFGLFNAYKPHPIRSFFKL